MFWKVVIFRQLSCCLHVLQPVLDLHLHDSGGNMVHSGQQRLGLDDSDLYTPWREGHGCLSGFWSVNLGCDDASWVMFSANLSYQTLLSLSFSDILKRKRRHFDWRLLVSVQILRWHHLQPCCCVLEPCLTSNKGRICANVGTCILER